ncbi:MAG: PBP1A family penicillin-binding protein [Luteitalea sp.]|nr:PBP1A family penicillin-binding protein [Luteitalea sp.]
MRSKCNGGAMDPETDDGGSPVAGLGHVKLLNEHLDEIRKNWDRARERHPRLVVGVVAAFALALVSSIAGVALFSFSLRTGLPDIEAIRRIGEMDQATAVYDAADKIAFTIYKEQRIDVPLGEVSPNLVHALIAIEDQRFYDHKGFDLIRIGSAAVSNIRSGRTAQGGSTITQQLARQSFLTPEKTYRRKLQELILAARIEQMYSKPEILELYLNKVYFGDGLYGIESASRGFFGKHASGLSVSEAALLAGLVKSPSTYAPTVSMERAVARRNLVLQVMHETGAIDEPTWQAARAEPAKLQDTLRSEEPHGQYFKEQVRRELVDRFGWETVYQGGLRVYSTIDVKMQQQAEAAVAAGLKALDERRKAIAARRKTPPDPAEGPLQAALIALDPKTGHVRAMIGGRDFDESHFNRAMQARRQPGSAFKPFVYAAALEAGFTPATLIENLNEPIPTLEGAWTPEDEHSTADSMSLRTGLRTSSNRAAVQLLQQVGIRRTVTYAKTLGVGDVPSVPSLALGSGEVTLQSLTAAYGAFANHGEVPRPMLIRRVEDREGRLLYTGTESTTRAISDVTAYLMSNMMADVINAGTAARVRSLGFTLPAAGKTGTTNDYHDAWFVGFTPTLLAGVWVGFDQPRTIMPNGFAADVAVPVWANFMKAATRGDKPEWLSPPAGVVTADVCRLSGKLASEGCENVEVVDDEGHGAHRSMVYTEYFSQGTEPKARCDLHPTRGIFGAIASVFSGSEKPLPPRFEDAGLPAAAAAAPVSEASSVATVEPPPPAPEPPKKKRGFWSRLFGRGDDDDDKNDRNRDVKDKDRKDETDRQDTDKQDEER